MEKAQQVESVLPKNNLWPDQDNESDEEEVEVGLLPRHSKHPNNGVGATFSSSSSSSSSSSTTTIADELEPPNEEMNDKTEEVESRGNGNSVYFDKLKGTRSVGNSEMHSEISKIPSMDINHPQVENVEDQHVFGSSPAVEHLHEETHKSSPHFHHATKVDSNVDLIGEIEEDLMDLDVERVLEKQNTHDLYCPKCNSCITRKVILVRRKPKISNIRLKPKRVKKLDPIPDSGAVDLKVDTDTPETYPNFGPTSAPDEQINVREEQEAFSCLSCFGLFIPIGNGCFKFFQFFRQGRPNEGTQSSQEISHSESPQRFSLSENTQSPQEINWKETTETPRGIILNESTQSPQEVTHKEDIQSPEKINHNYNTQTPQDKNQNENKQIPPTARNNWIFSIFAFRNDKKIVEKVQAGHAPSVQSAAVSIQSVTNVEYIDSAAIKPKEPEINNSLLDTVKPEPWEKKPDTAILPISPVVGYKIGDIEAGLQDPLLPPSTEVVPVSQTGTENESAGDVAGEAQEWEILKCIVYGGLVESITSLGVVTSAAGGGADTLNIFAMGLANLIGGLFVIIHNLYELKNDKPSNEINVEEDRYRTLLGRGQNFVLHATMAILSFLVFGLVPPVVYGFSFRQSNDKDYKLAAVAGASLICIILLALGKGHVKKPHRAYFKTVSYYVGLAITTTGISYVVGELIRKLIERLGLFESSSALSMPFLETVPSGYGQATF